MMRKSEYALWTLLVFAVLAAGSTMVGLARSETASAANSEIYRQLDLFGEVLERVRADYVEKPEDAKLIEIRDQRHADGARSAFRLSQSEALPRHAGADARRVRRPRHRGDHGERRGQGRRPDRGHAGMRRRASRAAISSPRLDKEQIQGLTLQEAVEKMRGPVNSAITLDHRAQGRRRSLRREGRSAT